MRRRLKRRLPWWAVHKHNDPIIRYEQNLAVRLLDDLGLEIHLVATRLRDERPVLYAEVDRLRAEAEVRVSAAVPLSVLAAVVALNGSMLSVVGVLAAPALFLSGLERWRRSNETVVDAVVVGKVEAPAVERLRTAVEVARLSAQIPRAEV